jgi:hypothetical protein
MFNVNLRRSRQVFSTLCCAAILGMIAVSLSILDAGAGRDVAWLSGSCAPGEPVSGQCMEIKSSGLLAPIEWVVLQRCLIQTRPQILSKKIFWF